MSSPEQDAPVILRQVNDVETLKALSDPLRLAILRTLMRDARASMTVKEIAKDLQQPITRLYRHVKLLESVGLIKVASTRVVSGIIEHQYQVAQLGLRLSRDLLAEPGNASEMAELFSATLDDFRTKLVRDILAGRLDSKSQDGGSSAPTPMVVALDKKLSAVRAAELRSRVQELVEEFNTPDDPDPSAVPVEFLLMFWSPREP